MTHVTKPTRIQAAGNKPKVIEEFIGRANTKSEEVSIARMKSPSGWIEPPQTPQFNEYTVVLKGLLHVRKGRDEFLVGEGQAFIAEKGAEVQYSTPGPEGAEYIAVCVPAFSPDTVHRKEE